MKNGVIKFASAIILVLAVIFVMPFAVSENTDSSFRASALLSSDSTDITRELVRQEMYDRYKEIYDFACGNNIDPSAQAVPFESGPQSADSEIVSKATLLAEGCTNDYDKAVELYNWIITNVYYDYDYYNGVTPSTNIDAVDVYKNKYTVCDGFTNLYTAMCRSVGVPCRKVIGYASNESVSDEEYFASYFKNEPNHAWNEIYVNDEWIVVDSTWDCGNTYSDGVFAKHTRNVNWFDVDFAEFATSHMGMTYSCDLVSSKFTFTIENCIVTASNYTGTVKVVSIPNGVHVIKNLSDSKKDFTTVKFPATLVEISDNAFKNCTALTKISVPDGVRVIGKEAFSGCTSLTNVTLPDSIESIGQMAFYECSSLSTIHIASAVTEIKYETFYGCSSLKTITGAQNVTILRYGAFMGCTLLEDCDFFNNLTCLEYYAFYDCESITSVYIPFTYTNIPQRGFNNCISLEKVVIAEGVTSIDEAAFYGCSSLSKVVLPSTLETIGEYAFCECASIEEIDLPEGLQTISDCAFASCINLKNIGGDIPVGVTYIGSYAFYDCILDGAYTIPDGITTISEAAFYQCSGITQLTIPTSVTAIVEFAFTRTNSLTDIYYLGTTNQWNEIAVGGNNSTFLAATVHCLGEHSHSFSSVVTKTPTCDEKGEVTYTCSCGDVYVEDIESNGHTEVIIPGSDATCTSTGLSDGVKCSVCGEIITEQTVIGKLPHSESGWITDKTATCSEAGAKHKECTICHTPLAMDTIDKLPHTHETITGKAETCTSTGLTDGVKCSVCGEIITAQTVIGKLPHSESGWITDKTATCSEEGAKHKECTICHTPLATDTIDKLPHTHETITGKAATCTSTGFTDGVKCSVCDEIITEQTVIGKLPHSESGWITDKTATCSEAGAKHKECTVCHTPLATDSIDKLPHNEEIILGTDATCNSTGLTDGVKCSVCGEIITVQTVIGKLPHSESEWIIDNAATCSEAGAKHKECTVCHTPLATDTIDKLPHTHETITGKAATCTSTGFTDGVKCSVCGEIITAQTVIGKLPHSESEWIIDKAATCSEVGTKHKECTVCHTPLATDSIDKLPHTQETIPGKAATCTATGLTQGAKCSVCGEFTTAQIVTDKLSHTESEWIVKEYASCAKKGIRYKECTVCDDVIKTEVIPVLAHIDSNADNKCDMCYAQMLSLANCSHMCHKDGFSGFIWSVINFFNKLFGINNTCECGVSHY